jgi:Na+-driven multidrug efflux pump
MVASAQVADRGTSDMPRTAKMMIGAMRMSTYVGAGLGAFLFVFARPLLRGIIGNDSINPAIFAAAMNYVRIRALGMPAAAILGSTQAACLGMQDIRSPLYVLGAAALINLLGDILFVGNSNPLIGGTAGAAWATVISQYAALAFFVRWLCKKAKTTEKPNKVMNLSDAILEMTSKPNTEDENGKSRRQIFRNALESFKLVGRKAKSMRSKRVKDKIFMQNIRKSRFGNSFWRRRENATTMSPSINSNNDESFSTRGFLENRLSTTDLLKLPDKETREKFSPFVLPVTTTQVGRVSGYVAMAHVVASSLGMVSMAAQQVIVSIFYCLCPIADSLSLTAQSFVPSISEKEASMEKAAAMKGVLINFLKAGGVFGGAMMAAVCGIPLLTGFFTSDKAVINLVNSVVPHLLVFFGVHGFVCASEGVLLGQKDLGFLGKMYASFFAAVPFMMLRVKKKALAGSTSVGLTSVWTVFIGYQLARCGFWLTRSAILQRRTNIEAKQAASMDIFAP